MESRSYLLCQELIGQLEHLVAVRMIDQALVQVFPHCADDIVDVLH